MTLYHYKAITKEGDLLKGVLSVSSLAELKTYLQEKEFSLIAYSKKMSFFFSSKVSLRMLMDFCLYLEQFENAGIPLKESLNELYLIQSNFKLKMTLAEIIKDLDGGYLFSKALAKHSSIFDAVFLGLIAAGEKTGRSSFIFNQLYHHLKWKDEMQAQTYNTLRYPLIMALVLSVVIFCLLTFLVPQLVVFIKISEKDLPLSTCILVSLSDFLSEYIIFIFLCFVLLVSFLTTIFKYNKNNRLWIDPILGRCPFIGPLRRNILLARFCHIFAVLFESGIDILQSLQTARQSIRYGELHYALEKVETYVREGQSLSTAFHKANYFPSLIVRMVKVGEQTSSLQKTLFYVKDYFDTALKRQVEHIIGLIEPIMMLSVGGIMAWIIYSIFLPLYDTISVLSY